MKAQLKKYLSITKKEWNGLVVLVVLIALVLAAPGVYQLFRKDTIINKKDFDQAVAQLSKAGYRAGDEVIKQPSDNKQANPVMFSFNPNNLSAAQWQQLGLSERQALVIK